MMMILMIIRYHYDCQHTISQCYLLVMLLVHDYHQRMDDERMDELWMNYG
jgi:hypothetical protein